MIKKIFVLVCISSLIYLQSCKTNQVETIELNNWKFNLGDDMNWAQLGFDDSKWKEIKTNDYWENQGYVGYDGYAWYRIKFILPSALKNNAYYKDSIQFVLGKVDDTDEAFLNGKLIGQNGKTIKEDGSNAEKEWIGKNNTYNIDRRYVLKSDDSRLIWDKENILTVRANDHYLNGGMIGPKQFISMVDIKDYISFDIFGAGFSNPKINSLSKSITITNIHPSDELSGSLKIEIFKVETGEKNFEETKDVQLPSKGKAQVDFSFTADQTTWNNIKYIYTEKKSGKSFTLTQDVPYILTPKPGEEPKINGARVFGAHPGKELQYTIAATGIRPMTFEVSHLPKGLVLDTVIGQIKGKVADKGEYKVVLKAKNAKGLAERELKIIIGDKLALTPPMGWNSWNCWGLSVDDTKVKAAADQMKASGLADHGWTFINMDDGWEAPKRAKNGDMEANEKFPDMTKLSDYVHSKGLKLGIYSSPGPKTCGGYIGSYEHELQDAKTYVKWGVDYLKYDWCSYSDIAPKEIAQYYNVDWFAAKKNLGKSLSDFQKPYFVMRDALAKVDRDIIFSLCQYGWAYVWEWGGEADGNSWRTTGDIEDTWKSLSNIGFKQDICAPYAKPGNWNDPDMLIVGWVGWGPTLHTTRLTASEQYTHISLWAMLSAPLLLGCDLTRLDDFTLNLLTNDEVIDIDQDPLGKEALPAVKADGYQIWVKELEDGSKALGMFNLSDNVMTITVNFSEIKVDGTVKIRNVWRQKDLGSFANKFDAKVPSHGVVLVKITM